MTDKPRPDFENAMTLARHAWERTGTSVTAGVLCLAAIATGGYAVYEHDTSTNQEQAVETTKARPVIAMDTLPEELPANIQKVLPNIVEITGSPLDELTHSGWIKGSGILLDGARVLTANHVIANDQGTRLNTPCSTLRINSMTTEPRTDLPWTDGHTYAVHGASTGVQSIRTGSYPDNDVALVTLDSGDIAQMDPVQPIVVRDLEREPLKLNEVTYMAAFGPNADGGRTPSQLEFLEEHTADTASPRLAMIHGQDKPHITGGIIFDTTKGIDVLTGLADYSEMPDATMRNRPGDSGGAAFDSQARLIGVLSHGDSETRAPRPLIDIFKHHVETGKMPIVKNQPAQYVPSSITLAPIDPARLRALSINLPVEC